MEDYIPHYFWKRMWAQIIDVSIVLVVHWLLGRWDIDYDLVNPWYVTYLETFIELFVIVALLVRFGQTPGKYLLGVKVCTSDGSKPNWVMAFKRQLFFLFIPLLILELLRFVHIADPFESEATTTTSLSSILLLFLTIGLMILFNFGSFLRWRGQTYWDYFAGTYVDKV